MASPLQLTLHDCCGILAPSLAERYNDLQYSLACIPFFLHYYGLGLIGLWLTLRGWRKAQWNAAPSFCLLLFFTLVLPYPLAFLAVLFVQVDSACNVLPYFIAAPLWAARTTVPAWLIFLTAWIYRAISKRRKADSQLPSRP